MIGSRITPVLLSLLPFTLAAPMRTTGNTHPTQVISVDFADPDLLQDGNQWWAFASNNHKTIAAVGGSLINVQIARSPDFNSWTVTGSDALPTVGAWADPKAGNQGAAVWAPSVSKNKKGQYVLTYSAAVKGSPGKHCVGAAVASQPQGPYTPQATPLVCPLDQGGAIDSGAFKDADGTQYVVYKIDGNSMGHGGVCGNTNAPMVNTPIMIQRVADDGFTPIGSPVKLLDRSDLDGPLIEAPSLARTSNGKYVLFFSSNCFATSNYDVTYAFADNIMGPYVKRGPMMVTGTNNLYAPGGQAVAADGKHMMFHAGDVGSANMGWRGAYTQIINIDTGSQVVSS
ncbi:Arabinanase/levansucrase/invertase [Aureobasidium pullulans]|uniref:Arabinanase/levansucrase/invertase n=1 Tax=Aureobasidium pullulans TaxID=5580 RepID=A0A4S9Y0I4_AURPU|nr:Arabinanase/levansucrase/invertase [Aureobasidium pullulans]